MPEPLKGLYVVDFSDKTQGFFTMKKTYKVNNPKNLADAVDYLQPNNDFIFVTENPDVECNNIMFPLADRQNYVGSPKIPSDTKKFQVITPEDVLSGKANLSGLQVKEGHHMCFFVDARWWMPVCIEAQKLEDFIFTNSKGVKYFKVNVAWHHVYVTVLRVGAAITPEFTWGSPDKDIVAEETTN